MAAPSKSSSKKKSTPNTDIISEEEVFLAVVIADSYDSPQEPCFIDRPKVSSSFNP